MTCYARLDGTDLVLQCHIQPGAKRSELAGEQGERLKIRLQAPPVEGKANKALIDFLADVLQISKKMLEIKGGETGRNKHILVRGIAESAARARLGLY